MINLILQTDSYKFSHPFQYPKGASWCFSYIESRGGHYDETLFFGLQYFLKKYLSNQVTMFHVEEARDFAALHGEPFPYEDWKYVVDKLGGFIPLSISAAPEGSVIPVHNALVTVESTDERCFWMPSWMETMLMRSIWFPTTVASQSFSIKGMIYDFLVKTANDPDQEINFKLHDFGARGVSSHESAGIGGMAHLVNFMGSDTVEGIVFANKYYNEKMSGYSIPASEHSTITSWGRANERAAYENMVQQFGKPGSLVAVVSDSYNIYDAVEKIWCSADMQNMIKEKGCTVVVRPDSGHPATVVNKILTIMDNKLGMTTNSKGFKVLPDHMRVIQGDGVNESSIQEILSVITRNGFSASNVAFGMGGALLQKVDRDTQQFAMKCSAIVADGKVIEVYKEPVDDAGKNSKRGILNLIQDVNGDYTTIQENFTAGRMREDSVLKLVYEDGELSNETTLAEVRQRANDARVRKLARYKE